MVNNHNHERINATCCTQAKTLSTTAGSGAGATLAFCTEEGYPLTPQFLEERRTLLLLPGFRHDALNIIAAAQMEGGVFQLGGDYILLGVQGLWLGLGPGRARRPPIWLYSIVDPPKPPTPEGRAAALEANRVLTGLHHISGSAMFSMRVVLAMAAGKDMTQVENANVATTILSDGVAKLVAARVTIQGREDPVAAVKKARARAAAVETQPLLVRKGGWGEAEESVDLLQLPPPSNNAHRDAVPPPTTTASSREERREGGRGREWGRGRGRTLPPPAPHGGHRGPLPAQAASTRSQAPGAKGGSGRSSRASSGYLSDFDELVIDGADIGSRPAPAPGALPPGALPPGALPPGALPLGALPLGALPLGAPALGALIPGVPGAPANPAPQAAGPGTGTNATTTAGGKADTAEVPAPMHAGQQTVPSKVPPPELTPGAERHKARQKLDTTSGLNLSLHFNNAATEQPEPGTTQADNGRDLEEETQADMEEELQTGGDPEGTGGPQDMGRGSMLMD